MYYPYLIQRGQFKYPLKDEAYEGLLWGRNGLLDFDYMGSAEFEWGALPRAYDFVFANGVSIEKNSFALCEAPYKTSTGVPTWLFCQNSKRDEITKAIGNLINDDKSRRRLKDPSFIETQFVSINKTNAWDIDGFKWRLQFNFWFSIDGNYKWMFFIGAMDRRNAFMRQIEHDMPIWCKARESEITEIRKDIKKGWN